MIYVPGMEYLIIAGLIIGSIVMLSIGSKQIDSESKEERSNGKALMGGGIGMLVGGLLISFLMYAITRY